MVNDRRVRNPASMARPADPHARSALVSAARREFARRGLKGARIEDITAACGLSKGAFYLHFPSKEALFGEVVGAFESGLMEMNGRRMARMEGFFQTHGIPGAQDRIERSDRYLRFLQLEKEHDLEALDWVWEFRDVSLVLTSGSQGTEFESLLWRVTDAQVERISHDFRRLQEAGAMDPELDARIFASIIVGSFLLLSTQMARLDEKPDLNAWANTLQRLCQEGTRPASPAPSKRVARRPRAAAEKPRKTPRKRS
ncbi:transcriptional regulator, TetR family [Myxococcus xanthus DK 1622]|uniref:Transcriptional regulator, TetR family n=2 Tax=Myxococcaceae TaxID=31 RepID=Q1DEJ0_MYXXD|nr:transcriptional regulator, TetR family [Myxococcus xanthus DK 1622]NOJ55438.1 TetR/AcrR family transcriptional regulator [Myxococcus xanthus]QPM80351.1 TetR/AcrR family transcriptional regulator [Myxococcus xanthus]QVW69414.1 TetR/AcrR family transcriptional regulator [Myxococcus xanthus DZ2]UEO04461.1 TetR/AcrR family transcriptional regulator [Myxococcus xanthus DZ2]